MAQDKTKLILRRRPGHKWIRSGWGPDSPGLPLSSTHSIHLDQFQRHVHCLMTNKTKLILRPRPGHKWRRSEYGDWMGTWQPWLGPPLYSLHSSRTTHQSLTPSLSAQLCLKLLLRQVRLIICTSMFLRITAVKDLHCRMIFCCFEVKVTLTNIQNYQKGLKQI